MQRCRHAVLTALPPEPRRLRCTVCHLTITEEELAGGSCPECYEARGERNDDFEVIEAESSVAKYRCETCGGRRGILTGRRPYAADVPRFSTRWVVPQRAGRRAEDG